MTQLQLYDYAASANCYKVRLLLAQLDRPYERIPIDIFAGETLSDDYAAKNPTRTTPVLKTEDGRFLPESNAILFYLGDSSPFLPDDTFDRAQVIRWLTYEQTDVIPTMGGLRFRLLVGRLKATDDEAIRRKQGGEKVLRLLDDHLAGSEFFVGNSYSIADIGIYGYVHVADEAGIDMRPYEKISAWLQRVRSRPGYMNNLEPYPPNAAPGAGRSLYD